MSESTTTTAVHGLTPRRALMADDVVAASLPLKNWQTLYRLERELTLLDQLMTAAARARPERPIYPSDLRDTFERLQTKLHRALHDSDCNALVPEAAGRPDY